MRRDHRRNSIRRLSLAVVGHINGPKSRREERRDEAIPNLLVQIPPRRRICFWLGSIRSSTWAIRCEARAQKKTGAFWNRRWRGIGHVPPVALSARSMAGLAILKRMHDLSDEALCDRWIENPYFQLYRGEEFFQHRLTFDRSSLTRWRQRMGEEKLVALIQESLASATRSGAPKPSDFSKIIVDASVQEKAAFPTDAKLMHRPRERLAGC